MKGKKQRVLLRALGLEQFLNIIVKLGVARKHKVRGGRAPPRAYIRRFHAAIFSPAHIVAFGVPNIQHFCWLDTEPFRKNLEGLGEGFQHPRFLARHNNVEVFFDAKVFELFPRRKIRKRPYPYSMVPELGEQLPDTIVHLNVSEHAFGFFINAGFHNRVERIDIAAWLYGEEFGFFSVESFCCADGLKAVLGKESGIAKPSAELVVAKQEHKVSYGPGDHSPVQCRGRVERSVYVETDCAYIHKAFILRKSHYCRYPYIDRLALMFDSTAMQFVIDIGNTNIVGGVFDGERLVTTLRIRTVAGKTEDEYSVIVKALLAEKSVALSSVRDVLISSVVPQLTGSIQKMCRRIFDSEPTILGPVLYKRLPVSIIAPDEIGADLVANACAAWKDRKSVV